MGQVAKRRDIPDFILEKLGVFQVLQAGKGRNVSDMIAGHDEDPEVREGGKPVTSNAIRFQQYFRISKSSAVWPGDLLL